MNKIIATENELCNAKIELLDLMGKYQYVTYRAASKQPNIEAIFRNNQQIEWIYLLYLIYSEQLHYNKCMFCEQPAVPKFGANLSKLIRGESGISPTCKCKECINKYRATDDIKNKRKSTVLKKYGTENVNQNIEVRSKAASTNLERYGHENPFGSSLIQHKIKETLKERLGVYHPAQNINVLNKMRTTNIARYGVPNALQNPSISQKVRKTRHGTSLDTYPYLDFINKEYCDQFYDKELSRVEFIELLFKDQNIDLDNISKCMNILSGRFRQFGYTFRSSTTRSAQEIRLISFLDTLHVRFVLNDRSVLKTQELDVYLPELNIAIEVNGVYWHSDKNKSTSYHKNKSDMCEMQGIQLLHIWDTEIDDPLKFDIWKSVIKSKIGLYDRRIYARKCKVRVITSKESSTFLDQNHLQGNVNAKHRYGLYFEGELVSVATFVESRFKKGEIELARFATLKNTQVIGGLSKLIKRFKNDNNIDTIISYANRRWSRGNAYSLIGTLVSTSNPNYWYSKGEDMLSRYQCQKHKIKKWLSKFDDKLSEYENMSNNGYFRVYDSGNLKYCI